MSSTLKDKIAVMKQKATMVKELESLCTSCESEVRSYQAHLDVSLPPSVLLETTHSDIRRKAVSLCLMYLMNT